MILRPPNLVYYDEGHEEYPYKPINQATAHFGGLVSILPSQEATFYGICVSPVPRTDLQICLSLTRCVYIATDVHVPKLPFKAISDESYADSELPNFD